MSGVLEGPSKYSRPATDWGMSFFGAANEPDELHGLVVMGLNEDAVSNGLALLDQYATASHAAHGALVLFDALSPTEIEPQLEHATTPAGRDVLVLRI